MSIVYWLTSAAALLGVWLNIKKHVASFCIWSFTNAIWTYADIVHGIYPQAVLQGIYFLLSLYGIRKWTSASLASGADKEVSEGSY